MNPYYESDLESRDLCCEECGKLISIEDYEDFGICEECYEKLYCNYDS